MISRVTLTAIAAKGNNFNARRRAKQLLPYSEKALLKLFKEIAPQYVDRPGGYTRVLKNGFRAGDSAPMAIIQFSDLSEDDSTDD